MNCVVVIYGPTASGKTKLALSLANNCNGEIINADSVCFYRKFNIGSAKPSTHHQKLIKHHLFSVVDPGTQCDAQWFCDQASQTIKKIHNIGKIPIIVGGSGLYIRALLGLNFHPLPADGALRQYLSTHSNDQLYSLLKKKDPDRASQIHYNDLFRLSRACEIAILSNKTFDQLTCYRSLSCFDITNPVFDPKTTLIFGIYPSLEILRRNITTRTHKMFKKGWIDEVKELLHDQTIDHHTNKALNSVGYYQIKKFLLENGGDYNVQNKDDLIDQITNATYKLAKSQKKWFTNQFFTQVFDEDLISCNKDFDLVVENIINKIKSSSI